MFGYLGWGLECTRMEYRLRISRCRAYAIDIDAGSAHAIKTSPSLLPPPLRRLSLPSLSPLLGWTRFESGLVLFGWMPVPRDLAGLEG